MGIRGLNTFFNQNPEFSKPYKLHDSCVVIDGNNLIHALYFNYKVNFMYGGDYKKYADAIRRYLSIYIECNIRPIIVFDGGYDKTDRKLETVIQRSKDRLSQTQYIAKHGCSSGKVLPILAHEVFRSVLLKLDVTFVQCDYEADDQITALANHYKCPAISADSDFYIFDLHKGFIHLESIDMTINLEVDSDGKEYKFLNCSLYHIDEFVAYFPGIDKSVLPLFGALIGNDFVKASEFDNFFSNIQLPKYKGRKLIINPRQKRMIGLLCWLKHNTLSEAINQVTLYLKKDKRDYVKSMIENAVDGYKLYHSNLLYIIEKPHAFKTELVLNNRLTTPCGKPLPIDIIMKLHSGEYPSFFINVITLHRIFLQPQVENVTLLSSYKCSTFIRQVLYGILVQHNECDNKACLASVQEYDRQTGNLQKVSVIPVFSLEGFGKLPEINKLYCLEEECSKLILSKVLAVNVDSFSTLPDDWQLVISCINYWLCNSALHPPEAFIYALVLNLIYFSLIKYKDCMGKKCNKTCSECSSIMCNLANIGELELYNASSKLKKYEQMPSFNRGNPLILSFIHCYSQLQTCILFTIYLNRLLGNFIKTPDLPKCLGGTFLYNVAKDISSRSHPELFVSEILGRETTLAKLFNMLKDEVCENVPSDCILKNISVQKSKKKKSKCDADLMNNYIDNQCSNNKFSTLSSEDLDL